MKARFESEICAAFLDIDEHQACEQLDHFSTEYRWKRISFRKKFWEILEELPVEL